MGYYGILTSVLTLISSVTDLGVSKSSIRNISEAKGEKDHDKIVTTVTVVSKLIFASGSIGALLTILLSYYLSIWTFGEPSYWLSFVLIGIAVFFTVVKNGQAAIFQGLREFSIITKNTIITASLSFFISIPLLFFFGKDGILYTVLATAFIGFVISKFYVEQLEYKIEGKNNVYLTRRNSQAIIKLGVAMMLVSFLVALSGYVIRAYISVNGSLVEVGHFQAGFQIISGYFGIIFTSMASDYFPRISAINKDDAKLETEVNQQAVISLLLICPLVVILPYIMPFIIPLLYSKDFAVSVDYVNVALFGIVFQAGSQTMGMIFLAKNNVKIYTLYVFSIQMLCLLINIIGYSYMGILGLGITFSLNMFIHLLSTQLLVYHIYKISFDSSFLFTLLVILAFSVSAFITKDLNGNAKLLVASLLILLSFSYTVYSLKSLLKIRSLADYLKKKLTKR